MIRGEITRRLIEVILENGLKFGIDAAGGFLGPAWPIVRPLVEKLLDGFPKSIAGRYRSSAEAIAEAQKQLKLRSAEIETIGEALAKQGITEEWASSLLSCMESFSDDLTEILTNQAGQGITLEQILSIAKDLARKRPGNVVVQGERLEYVDFLRVSEEFMPGYDLSPTSIHFGAVSARHLPAGFLIWNFMVFNSGNEAAAISKIEFQIKGEYPYPEGSTSSELKPRLVPFEDRVFLASGVESHTVFKGELFSYSPSDVDAFRVQLVFAESKDLIQQIQPCIRWSNSSGNHLTFAPPLFLASREHPQLELAEQKFDFGKHLRNRQIGS